MQCLRWRAQSQLLWVLLSLSRTGLRPGRVFGVKAQLCAMLPECPCEGGHWRPRCVLCLQVRPSRQSGPVHFSKACHSGTVMAYADEASCCGAVRKDGAPAWQSTMRRPLDETRKYREPRDQKP